MSKIRLTYSARNVVLVGHMGSGKTSIGKKLSKKIEFKFIDTDEEIEKKIKMTISEFFINNSERKFRNLEEEIVKSILSKNTKSIKVKNLNSHLADTAYINLIYKNKLNVFIKNSWISPIKIRLIKFKFKKAIIHCNENEPIYKIKIFKKKNKSNLEYSLIIYSYYRYI